MRKDIGKIIKVASVYTGIILGAGFASGQELILFFTKYGVNGIFGLMLSGITLAVSGWAVLDICCREKIKSYDEFMKAVFGDKLGKAMDFVIGIFIFILFCAMLAATGALADEAFHLPFSIGVIALAVLCFITFLFDMEGIVKINVVLSPMLVIGGIFLGLYTIFNHYTPVFLNSLNPFKKLTDNWIWSAVIYSSYNIITAISVLSNMSELVTSRKIAKYAGLLGGFCMCLLGLCFSVPLLLNFEFVNKMEIPMLGLSQSYGKVIEYFYIFLLLSAIFTTAVANGFSVIEWCYRKTKINKIFIKIMVTLMGIAAAHIGFSIFVGRAYSLFGYIGLFEIVTIIIYFIFAGKKKLYK